MKFRNLTWVVLLVGVVALALEAPTALAAEGDQTPVIDDGGDFFSPPAVADATRFIERIKDQFNIDLRIVTYDKLPAAQAARFKAGEKNAFYSQWAGEVARGRGSPGILILVVDDPRHLEISVSNRLIARQFTRRDRDDLRDLMVNRFHNNAYDRGLGEGVRLLAQRLEDNQQPGAAHFSQGAQHAAGEPA